MSSIYERFKNFLEPLAPAQRALFFGLSLAVIVLIGTLFYWALRPSYSLLFGSLKQDSAQEITQALEERGVQYKLENGGEAIYVQDEKVDQLRLELAPMGSPKSDMKGYELFDSNSLGMTDYMQRLNNRRALEGELSQSVNTLRQVETSRVHLVLPERSPFEENSVKASASVLLTVKNGEKLSKKNVNGITSLIAGSVEGLDPKDVTVVDHAGNRLTDGGAIASGAAGEESIMKAEQKTETYLTQRGQSMLDRVVGPGNSIVRVAVEQDFDSLVRRSNNIDPGSRTLVSEEQNEETVNKEESEMIPVDEFTPVENRGETAVVSTDENEMTSRTREYEVSETQEVFRKSTGEITNISASVLLNHKRVRQENEDGEMVWQNQEYSEEELAEFREAVASAIGIRPERGDEITIKQVDFWTPTDQPSGYAVPNPWPIGTIFRWVIILLALGVIAWLLRSLKKQAGRSQGLFLDTMGGTQKALAGDQSEAAVEGMSEEDMQSLISGDDEPQERQQPSLEEKGYDLEEIVNMVEMKPSKAAKLVRAMMIKNDNS